MQKIHKQKKLFIGKKKLQKYVIYTTQKKAKHIITMNMSKPM